MLVSTLCCGRVLQPLQSSVQGVLHAAGGHGAGAVGATRQDRTAWYVLEVTKYRGATVRVPNKGASNEGNSPQIDHHAMIN